MKIYGDWGTTHLRLWRVEHGEIFDIGGGPGIGSLVGTPGETLREALKPLSVAEVDGVVLCGMAGARNGLHEVSYAACPADLDCWRAAAFDIEVGQTPVRIAAGLSCLDRDGRPEVMRGEEAQVFGAIRLSPSLAKGTHTLVLPGTHSKWVRIDEGRVTSFRTFLTGELYSLLRQSSLFAMSSSEVGADSGGFLMGVERAQTGHGLIRSLFETRSAQILAGRGSDWAQEFLSGLLIGSEVREANVTDHADNIVMIGDPALTARYAAVLAEMEMGVTRLDGNDCVLAGLELLDAND